MPKGVDLSDTIKSVVDTEKILAERMDRLKKDNPAVFAEIDKINKAYEEVESLKTAVKKSLEEAQDYDVHEESGVRVSVSRIVRVGVENIDEVSDDFKETQTLVVANEKKAIEYARVFGELPRGFVDKSYSRLNWKVVKNGK